MSRRGNKNASVRRDKSSTTSAKSYKIYAINFHGSGLTSIRDQFIERIQDGLRRYLFVIDLEQEKKNDEKLKANEPAASGRNSLRKKARSSIADNGGKSGLLGIALNAIRERRRIYDELVAQIEKEETFDFVNYLMKGSDSDLKQRKSEKSLKPKTSKDKLKSAKLENKESDILCPSVVASKHNIIGNGKDFKFRKYIDDEPPPEILYFVFIGELNMDFYTDLLGANQPLQAIINFLPEESAWNQLVPRQRISKYIRNTMAHIQNFFCEFRYPHITKPVGIFQTQLPIISICLARKYSNEIFNELSWYLYDVEILLQQYYMYYVDPFIEINVTLPGHVDLVELREKAIIFDLNGHYMCHPVLGVVEEKSTFALYLDMLFNTVDKPEHILTNQEISLFAAISVEETSEFSNRLRQLMERYKHCFQSITKVRRYDRVFIEEANTLMTSLVSNSRLLAFRSLFRNCLEYNLQRHLHCTPFLWGSIPYKPYDSEGEVHPLPPYAKLYATEDSVLQRLNELLDDFDDYEVEEIYPGHKLYYFRRTYNEIFEYEKRMVVPTRLCFRDFTIYQMEEFLQTLITPELRKAIKEAQLTEDELRELAIKELLQDLDGNIFVRPDSLKTQIYGSQDEMRSFGECAKRFWMNECEMEEEETGAAKTSDGELRNYIGLPPNSPLLTGYNLEDKRQIIRVKTSKFYFEEGFLKLYEDCWNFDEMNRSLEWKLNNIAINLVATRRNTKHISRNIRVTTGNKIALRILNTDDESIKLMLNYPNGLSVHYHDTHTEQIWQQEDTFANERRRLFTPYGAVIVHYIDEMMILVMRYNGEVYRLFQYELGKGGEEEDAEELDKHDSTSQTKSATSTAKANKRKSDKSLKKEDMGDSESVGPILSSLSKTESQLLRETVSYERKFIEFLAKIYGLKWLHLRITTSDGRIFNEPMRRKPYEGKRIELTEWHDYYVNESYAMRSDCVHTIWTESSIKCYHADGTVIITNTTDCMEDVHEEETDSRISTSSSHADMEIEKEQTSSNTSIKGETKPAKKRKADTSSLKNCYLEAEEFGGEVEETPDPRYVKITCTNFLEQHASYASVYIICPDYYEEFIDVFMEVWALDGIRMHQKSCLEMNVDSEDGNETVEEMLSFTVAQPIKGRKTTALTVWISDCLYLYVTDQRCEICTIMQRYNENFEQYCDCIEFCFDFETSLTKLFHQFADKISRFKNVLGAKSKVFYFLEKVFNNCHRQGFEFMEKMPPLCEFNFAAGNTFTEFTPIKTLSENYQNCFDWYNSDMLKFPRFPTAPTKESRAECSIKDAFPWVFKSNFYIHIPRQLNNTEKIHVFLKAMEKVNFKKLRRHMNEALIYYIRPQIRAELRRYISYVSWKIRKQQHIRRLLVEQQRKGLYHAMLKYEEYPDYYKFTEDFNGQVRDIDFFEFMLGKCNENSKTKAPKTMNLPPPDRKKKCVCPKFTKSLEPPIKRGCCPTPNCK